MKGFKNKLYKLDLDELVALMQEYQDLTASCAHECDRLYDRLHCIRAEIVDRRVREIPNAEKYILNYREAMVEVFFSPTQSKKLKIADLIPA